VGIFADAPIRRKITGLMVLVSTLSIMILGGAVFFLEIRHQHRSLVDKVATLADIVIENSSEGMILAQSYLVTNVLGSLTRERNLRAAFVFRDGKPFAKYLNPQKTTSIEGISYFPCPLLDRATKTVKPEYYFSAQHLGFVSPYYVKGKLIGHIYLQYGLDDLQQSLIQLATVFVLIILIVVGLSIFVSSRLQGVISSPIQRLVETMGSVSSQQDFSLRAEGDHQDEIGSLIAGFNHMLGQLQFRDQELERHRHDLELLVEERTHELDRVNRDLQNSIHDLELAKNTAEQASRAKSQFLANMSHEIRTPMIGVLGMTELLFDTQLNEKQQHLARTVFKSGEALLEIINELLDFSKIEAGKLEITCEDFSLSELVAEVLKLLAEAAQNKHLDLTSQFDPDLPVMVAGDSGRIRQILLNLVGNAVKFSEHGGVVVRVYQVRTAGFTLIRFEVEDSGIGIPTESLDSIFDSFTQGDDSTTRHYGGTGLGLAIVKQLAELMGGEVTVTSQVGEGSCFRVDLPLAPVDQQAPRQRYHLGCNLGGRVLLITDDDELSLNISNRLIEFGLRGESVNSGSRALQILQSDAGQTFQLALIDADMSGLGGLRLVEKISEIGPLAELKLMMLAGQEHAALSTSPSSARVDRWMYKPLQYENFDLILIELFADPLTEAEMNPALPDTTLLLVEDDRVTQDFVRGILAQTEFRLQIASNGAEALALLQSHSPELIFMDCQMPVLDGFEATQHIRQTGHQMPIVALTARVFAADAKRCLDAGMDDFLRKPFRQQDLLAMIDKWLPGGQS